VDGARDRYGTVAARKRDADGVVAADRSGHEVAPPLTVRTHPKREQCAWVAARPASQLRVQPPPRGSRSRVVTERQCLRKRPVIPPIQSRGCEAVLTG